MSSPRLVQYASWRIHELSSYCRRRTVGLKFLGRGQRAPFHQLRGLGSAVNSLSGFPDGTSENFDFGLFFT